MGTRLSIHSMWKSSKDHPHAYGDKNRFFLIPEKITGSSPRVWGQGKYRKKSALELRIIPTRMGTSSVCVSFRCKLQDHPHAYGDKQHRTNVKQKAKGSSPRVWGQVYKSQPYEHSHRIIPTRMGTSFLLVFFFAG